MWVSVGVSVRRGLRRGWFGVCGAGLGSLWAEGGVGRSLDLCRRRSS